VGKAKWRKRFFFEKKNQKTFGPLVVACGDGGGSMAVVRGATGVTTCGPGSETFFRWRLRVVPPVAQSRLRAALPVPQPVARRVKTFAPLTVACGAVVAPTHVPGHKVFLLLFVHKKKILP
jgi:hypothetical protein